MSNYCIKMSPIQGSHFACVEDVDEDMVADALAELLAGGMSTGMDTGMSMSMTGGGMDRGGGGADAGTTARSSATRKSNNTGAAAEAPLPVARGRTTHFWSWLSPHQYAALSESTTPPLHLRFPNPASDLDLAGPGGVIGRLIA